MKTDSQFIGRDFVTEYCRSLPMATLLHIQDLRQAGYSDPQIMESLHIKCVPPNDLISDLTIICLNCGEAGHSSSGCSKAQIICSKSLDSGHAFRNCLVGWRCRECKQLGHKAHWCPSRLTKIWRIKGQGPIRE
jgi:hypothetical protein